MKDETGQTKAGHSEAGHSETGQSEVDPAGVDPTQAGAIEPDPAQRAVLDAIDDVPTRFETILLRTGLSIGAAAEACDLLVERGSIISGAGWWSRNQNEPYLARR